MTFGRFLLYACAPSVGEERIQAAQRRLGVRLPVTFLDIVRQCDRGILADGMCFDFRPIGSDTIWTDTSGQLASFREPMPPEMQEGFMHDSDRMIKEGCEYWWSIEEILDNPMPPPLDGLIPFTSTGGGDGLCFDYRQDKQTDNPPIAYLDEELYLDPEFAAVSIAENFDAFLAILVPCPRLEV